MLCRGQTVTYILNINSVSEYIVNDNKIVTAFPNTRNMQFDITLLKPASYLSMFRWIQAES